MRFMVIVKVIQTSEAGEMPSEELLVAVGRYNEELVEAGVMLAGEGLQPSAKDAWVRFSGNARTVIDGSFAETRELITGFWTFQVASLEEAIERIKRCPNPFDDESEIEIRQVFEAEDFGEEFTPEPCEREERLCAELEKCNWTAPHSAKNEESAMQIVPYLIFNGNCREAFSCHHQHLGDTLEAMLSFGDSPECGDIPANWKDKIMHARLVVGSFALMASDNYPTYPYEGIKGCSANLNVDSKAEAERLFNALAKGGSVQMPLGPTFWAASFGMFTDRFGVTWMVNCEQDR